MNSWNKIIYMDNAATTFLSEKVLQNMLPYLTKNYGNPSSTYSLGREAKKAIENARKIVADCIGAKPNEIYFTSGGTESDNWAIKGIAYSSLNNGKNHIITSKIEHHAVLYSLFRLSNLGFDITYLDVDSEGLINLQDLKEAIRPETALVTIMYANNEIGTIEPIEQIGEICKAANVFFHTDAVQAVGNININVKNQNIDLLSLSAHKFHGPKGIGALYIREGILIENLMDGGAQENKFRAGTENVSGAVGLASAIKIACTNIEKKSKKTSALRDKIISNFLKIKCSKLNGSYDKRLPGNINMCFADAETELLLPMLDAKGICISSGSACTAGSLEPSHVLLSIGLSHEEAHSSIRISLGDCNTDEEVNYLIKEFPIIINKLRSILKSEI